MLKRKLTNLSLKRLKLKQKLLKRLKREQISKLFNKSRSSRRQRRKKKKKKEDEKKKLEKEKADKIAEQELMDARNDGSENSLEAKLLSGKKHTHESAH